jgi:hypothetical protein
LLIPQAAICNWLPLQLFDKSTAKEMAGFDNVGFSMISVFQSMTLSNWSFTMYRTMDYLSPVVVMYWLAMIIFGAYFVVSCAAGILLMSSVELRNAAARLS